MAKSARMRAEDCGAIVRLTGDCRDLGDDRHAWREQALAGLARLVDAELGIVGEMAGCRSMKPLDLGTVTYGWQTGFVGRSVFDAHFEAFNREPQTYMPTMVEGFKRFDPTDGFCLRRTDLRADRAWYASAEYQRTMRSFEADHILWCFRPIPTASDENFGLVIFRGRRRRDFDSRELRLVHETAAALAPLLGGPLARFSEPSPLDLPPRARQVLACLLEGDGDKQVAARLRLSPHTVNQYVKLIFRHFGVSSRAELLARWIRRGWGGRSSWLDA
jgi:DNA-binding CsgD family transcriptional regulator